MLKWNCKWPNLDLVFFYGILSFLSADSTKLLLRAMRWNFQFNVGKNWLFGRRSARQHELQSWLAQHGASACCCGHRGSTVGHISRESEQCPRMSATSNSSKPITTSPSAPPSLPSMCLWQSCVSCTTAFGGRQRNDKRICLTYKLARRTPRRDPTPG